MAKYRIIPSKHCDIEYGELFELQKKSLFGWTYLKMSRDKNKLIKFVEFMGTPAEYHTDG